ncbi:MAG: hypothetical protein AAGH15_28965 [Myxococcota bacterium]
MPFASLARLVAALVILMGILPAAARAQTGERGSDLGAPRPAPGPETSHAVPPPPSTPDLPAPRYEAPPSLRPADEALAGTQRQLPRALATRLRVLGTNLQILGSRNRQRRVDGVLSVLSGGVSVGFGVWARRDETTERGLARYLFLWGSAGLVRGVVSLALDPRAQEAWAGFRSMPSRDLGEAQERLLFGEEALERIARRARIGRFLDSALNVAVGAAVLPVYLAPKDFNIDQPFDYFVIIGSAISVISGIVTLATPSDAERRWRSYRELVRLEERAAETAHGLRLEGLGVAPRPGGAKRGLRARG